MKDGHPLRWNKKDHGGIQSLQGKKLPNRNGPAYKSQTRVAGNYIRLQRWNDKQSKVCKIEQPENDDSIGLRKNEAHLEDSVLKVNLTDNGGRTFGIDLLYLLYFIILYIYRVK